MTRDRHAPRPHYLVTLALLGIGVMAYSMQISLIGPVLPTIRQSLHASQPAIAWAVTGYLLSASIATPIGGRMGDLWGTKRVLVVVLTVFALGALGAALATSVWILIGARLVQGVGGAMLPLTFAIIRAEFPPGKVAMGVSTVSAMLAVGSGVGLVVTGPLVNAVGWHCLFWALGGLLAAAATAAHFLIPGSPPASSARISFWPALLLSFSLSALLIGISEGNDQGWVSGRVAGLLAAAAASFCLWVRTESRAAHPLIDMEMMRHPTVRTTNLAAFLVGISLYAGGLVVPAFLQEPSAAGYGFGATLTQSGIFMLPWAVGSFVFGSLSGLLAQRWGAKRILLAGALITASAYLQILLAHGRSWQIYTFTALIGAGLGFAYAALAMLIVNAVPGRQVGAASGVNANLRTIGGAVGAAVATALITSGSRSGAPAVSGYVHAFAFLLIASLLTVAAAVLVPGVTAARPWSETGTNLCPAPWNMMLGERRRAEQHSLRQQRKETRGH